MNSGRRRKGRGGRKAGRKGNEECCLGGNNNAETKLGIPTFFPRSSLAPRTNLFTIFCAPFFPVPLLLWPFILFCFCHLLLLLFSLPPLLSLPKNIFPALHEKGFGGWSRASLHGKQQGRGGAIELAGFKASPFPSLLPLCLSFGQMKDKTGKKKKKKKIGGEIRPPVGVLRLLST